MAKNPKWTNERTSVSSLSNPFTYLSPVRNPAAAKTKDLKEKNILSERRTIESN